MKWRTLLVLSCCFLASAGCGSENKKPPPPPPEEISNRDVSPVIHLPVRQVRQTLNLTRGETMSVALEILKRNNIPVDRLDEEQGLVETKWIDVDDHQCGFRMVGAPLRCRTTFSFKIEDFEHNHSVINARFDERCSINDERDLHCAASEGERIMVAMIDQLRTVDASVQPKSGWFTVTTPGDRTPDPYVGE